MNVRRAIRDARDLIRPTRRTSWSQYAEDLVLLDVLSAGSRGRIGTYIDVGCNHPKRFSNTYALYRAGWRGLAVDLDASLCMQFRVARPRDRVVCAALGAKAETKTVYRFTSSELSTTNPEWAARFVSEGQTPAGQEEMHVLTLDQLLTEHRSFLGDRIDLLTIDAEGSEQSILQGLDFGRMRPAIVMLEVPTEIAMPADGAIGLLEGEGYRLRARLYNSAIWQDARAAQRPR
jgi:FkbM family methyltransferase